MARLADSEKTIWALRARVTELEEQLEAAQAELTEWRTSMATEKRDWRIAELQEQLEAAREAIDKGRRFERAYQESLGATPTAAQYEILDNLQSAFLDAYLALDSFPATSLCPDCDGVGAQAGAHTERVNPCPTCEGTGRKKVEAAG